MSSPPALLAPCLWLDGTVEAAAALYTAALPNTRLTATSRCPSEADNPAGRPRGGSLTIELDLDGQPLTLLDGGPAFRPNPSISLFVHADDAVQADDLHAALSDGGAVLMPLGAYPWSPRYAWVADRFGVSWQIMTGRRSPGGPRVAPCLMFANAQRGRAEAALQEWAGLFAETRVVLLDRYGAGEGPAGLVKHARLAVGGQELVAMDSHVDHPFGFDEGVSLQVRCPDQAAVDRCWEALSAGGAPGRCGWVTDRFGISWQVVPAAVSRCRGG